MPQETDFIDQLERRFGDPWDESNPVGFAALLASDEKDEMSPAGEALLDEFGLNSHLVPVGYGGKLKRVDDLIALLRAVYRRDPCLGLGYGGSSFIASCNVWTAGSEEQCAEAAELLTGNAKLACSYYELPHGNDLTGIEFEANPGVDGDTLILNGSKQVTSNVERGEGVVVYARTQPGTGSRSHSLVFVNKRKIDTGRVRYLPRFPTMGMRGVQLGGIEFEQCPVPRDAILGDEGQALETAIKSFQITRTALPGMFIGILDTGLRVAVRYATQRRLYGRTVAELPHARGVLARAFSDLLLCDCFSTVVARALHANPRETSIYAPAVKYLVPKILNDAMNQLAAVLGANFYLREGEYSVFQKLQRDLKPVGFGHVSRVACLMTIMPKLPHLARRGWQQPAAAPEAIFKLGGELPPLSYKALRIDSAGRDGLAGSLLEARAVIAAAGMDADQRAEVLPLLDALIAAFEEIKQQAAQLRPGDLTNMASPGSYDLTSRYVGILAASACVNVWLHNQDGDDAFVKGTDWLLLALERLSGWIGYGEFVPSEKSENALFDELMRRYEQGRTFDLSNRQLPEWYSDKREK